MSYFEKLDNIAMDKRAALEFKLGPTDEERERFEQLAAIACEYHEATEAFDLTVCTSRGPDGTAMPADSFEMGQINRNALALHRVAREKAALLGFTAEQLQRAITDAAKNHSA